MDILGIPERDLRANKPIYLFTSADKPVYVRVASIEDSEAWLEAAALVEDAERALVRAKAGAQMEQMFSRRTPSGAAADPSVDTSRLNEDDGEEDLVATGGTPVLPLAAARKEFQRVLLKAVQTYPGMERENLKGVSWSQIMSAFWLLKSLSDPFDFSQAMTEAVTDRQLSRLPKGALEKALDRFGNAPSTSGSGNGSE